MHKVPAADDPREPSADSPADPPADSLSGPLDPALQALDPADIDVALIQREELAASRKLAGIEAGRRKAGLVGAVMAGTMLTLQEIYEGPAHDVDIVVESESTGKLGDIDADGIEVNVGDVSVWAPPPSPSQAPPDGDATTD